MFTAGLIEDIFPEVIGLFLLITFARPMNYLASYLSLTQRGATGPSIDGFLVIAKIDQTRQFLISIKTEIYES